MAKSGSGEMPEKNESSFSGQAAGMAAKGVGDRKLQGSLGDGGRSAGAAAPGETAERSSGGSPAERPDFRVIQTEYDNRLGKTVFKDVGAMWRGTSKAGSDYYTLKIGKLRLLVFPNNKD